MSSNNPCDKGPIQSYAELQAYMDCMVNQYGTSIAGAPHHAFWNTLTYEQFTTGTVPGVDSVQILVIGNGAGSNIVQALLGTAGTPFDPNGGQYGQMPADGTGPWTPDQIQPLIDWIDAKCPNNG
jgi:hypothetical protein